MSRALVVRCLVALCLLAANVAVAVHLVRSSWRPEATDGVLRALGSFRTVDGRSISLSSHRPWLIETIDPQSDEVQAEISDTLYVRLTNSFNWIILTSHPEELAKKVQFRRDNPYIFQFTTIAAKEMLHEKQSGDLWSLYDNRQVLWSTGNFSHGGLPGDLATLVDGAPRFSAAFVRTELVKLDKMGVFYDLHKAARTVPQHEAVVLFASDVSTGCAIEDVLRRLNITASQNRNFAYFIVVPEGWTADQINALRINLNIDTKVAVSRGNAKLTAAWFGMVRRFGSFAASDFLVVFSTNDIARVAVTRDQIPDILKSDSDAE